MSARDLPRIGNRPGEVRGELGGGAAATERRPPGEELERNASEAVQVGAAVDRRPLGLFRADVVERPDEHAGLGERAASAPAPSVRAMPKSASRARSWYQKMFSGLRSRCTTPLAWA